jgi:hypothetical protein
MNLRSSKNLLLGAVASVLAVPGLALAEPTCAYVLSQVDSVTVATPAIVVLVPELGADIQPVRVHLDPTEQNIVGYSVRTPGIDQGVDPGAVFVPAYERTIAPIVATLPALSISTGTCLNVGVSTPAVPVHVPASALQVPGVSAETPAQSISVTVNGAVHTARYLAPNP